MGSFGDRLDDVERDLKALAADVAKVKETLKNFSGTPPTVKGYSGAQLTLNSNLDIVELRKELKAIGELRTSVKSIQEMVDSISRRNGQDMVAVRGEVAGIRSVFEGLQEAITRLQQAVSDIGNVSGPSGNNE